MGAESTTICSYADALLDDCDDTSMGNQNTRKQAIVETESTPINCYAVALLYHCKDTKEEHRLHTKANIWSHQEKEQ